MEQKWEKLLHIKTTGRDDSNADCFRYPYEPTPYPVLERLANSGFITKKNVLLDYGSGKGRVDFFAAYQIRCKAIGIEYDERIIKVARENQKLAVSADKVEFVQERAEHYLVPAEVDRVYFFNPFSVEVLKQVMSRVLDSYYEFPRDVLLFFYYPSDEYVAELLTMEELAFYDEIDCTDLFENTDSREKILIFEVM